MNILGNVGVDTGGPYQLNKVGLLKTMRMALMVAAGSVVAFIITSLPGLDLVTGTDIDTMIMSLVVTPLLEAARRWLTDYSKNEIALGKGISTSC